MESEGNEVGKSSSGSAGNPQVRHKVDKSQKQVKSQCRES